LGPESVAGFTFMDGHDAQASSGFEILRSSQADFDGVSFPRPAAAEKVLVLAALLTSGRKL
jgi:hypothetical protein